MHSISTRATVHGRRRTLTRVATVAGCAVVGAGFAISSAFAATNVSVDPLTSSLTINGAPVTVRVEIPNQTADVLDLSAITLAPLCMTATPGAPSGAPPLTDVCGTASTDFQIGAITVDPASFNCTAASPIFSQVLPEATPGNAQYTVNGISIGTSGDCILDVPVRVVGSAITPGTYYFVAGAVEADPTAGTTLISSNGLNPTAFLVNAGPAVTPPAPPAPPVVVHDRDHDGDRDHRRHVEHRCTPDTPNNGNGNIGYGNNGNGNVGNCNNGNGNVGDDNNGNGNGAGDHDRD